jgi:hypothetical protein
MLKTLQYVQEMASFEADIVGLTLGDMVEVII